MGRSLVVVLVAACYFDAPAPVANVVHPARAVPYAAMMTALCGRTETAWDDAPPELAGIALVPNHRDDESSLADRRSWRVIGAPPFRELREVRNGPLVGRAELQLEHGSPRAICTALATDTRIEIQRSAADRCAWQDPDSTHTLEVVVRNGHAWMVCTL